MSNREWLVLVFVVGTFVLVGVVLWILVSRRYAYHQPDYHETRIMRSQNNNEHAAHESIMRKIDKNIDRMMSRFGFLDDPHQKPPHIDVEDKKK